jgi:ABC-type amino acid transport system permease subunit
MMAFFRSPWPAHWGRKQRSNASMGVAVVAMVLVLWLLAHLVALAPEPIGSNAQAFAEGARVTVELTLVSGVFGIVLSLNVGAYNAEAIRSGLLAVPKGQLEAARSLGMNNWFTFLDVTLPQAFKIALPPLVNNIVALLKDSSLASVIGLVELTNTADLLRAKTYLPIPSLVTSAAIYLLLTTVMTHFSGAVERRFDIEDKLA